MMHFGLNRILRPARYLLLCGHFRALRLPILKTLGCILDVRPKVKRYEHVGAAPLIGAVRLRFIGTDDGHKPSSVFYKVKRA